MSTSLSHTLPLPHTLTPLPSSHNDCHRGEWGALGRDTLLQLREDLNLLDDQVRFAELEDLDELVVCIRFPPFDENNSCFYTFPSIPPPKHNT